MGKNRKGHQSASNSELWEEHFWNVIVSILWLLKYWNCFSFGENAQNL